MGNLEKRDTHQKYYYYYYYFLEKMYFLWHQNTGILWAGKYIFEIFYQPRVLDQTK